MRHSHGDQQPSVVRSAESVGVRDLASALISSATWLGCSWASSWASTVVFCVRCGSASGGLNSTRCASALGRNCLQ
jgi:hypothetical protein